MTLAHPGIDAGARPLWAAEASAFARAGFAHLQASPRRGPPVLKSQPPAWSETRLALDGEMLGVASDATIAGALEDVADALPPRRAFVVRGLLGASVDGLTATLAALRPNRLLFWLHDFASLCTSARLLRNDVAFCGAPPLGSQACAICVHGEARAAHLAAMRRLFSAARFTVVAPSQSALDLWRAASDLPHERALVVAPAHAQGPEAPDILAEAPARPVQIAFLGPPTLARGWHGFERVVAACGDLEAYEFHHLAEPGDLRPSRNLHSAEAGPLYFDALAARRIDFVVAAAEGPESFSWGPLEAMNAGADLLAFAHSGHAAELIAAERRGLVFADDDELLAFFTSGRAVAYARERARFPRALRRIAVEAPTAALIA